MIDDGPLRKGKVTARPHAAERQNILNTTAHNGVRPMQMIDIDSAFLMAR